MRMSATNEQPHSNWAVNKTLTLKRQSAPKHHQHWNPIKHNNTVHLHYNNASHLISGLRSRYRARITTPTSSYKPNSWRTLERRPIQRHQHLNIRTKTISKQWRWQQCLIPWYSGTWIHLWRIAWYPIIAVYWPSLLVSTHSSTFQQCYQCLLFPSSYQTSVPCTVRWYNM